VCADGQRTTLAASGTVFKRQCSVAAVAAAAAAAAESLLLLDKKSDEKTRPSGASDCYNLTLAVGAGYCETSCSACDDVMSSKSRTRYVARLFLAAAAAAHRCSKAAISTVITKQLARQTLSPRVPPPSPPHV
jgi:hypothetical protein